MNREEVNERLRSQLLKAQEQGNATLKENELLKAEIKGLKKQKDDLVEVIKSLISLVEDLLKKKNKKGDIKL